MIYAISIALAMIAFLVVLNGLLRGAMKTQIDALLSVLLLSLLIAAFVVGGWKLGLLAIPIGFLSAVITQPFAARAAARLFSAGTGEVSAGYVGLPPRALQRISKQLGGSVDPSQFFQEMHTDRRTTAEDTLFDYCESQPGVQDVMNEFQVSRDDLREVYHLLLAAGAGQWACGHWVAASALAYPEALRYILRRRGENIMETAFNVGMYFERGSALDG
jgi:hypothetical protein